MPTQLPNRLIAVLAAAILTGNLAYAQGKAPRQAESDPVFEVRKKKSDLKIVEKFAKILKLDKRITTVYGFDQEVVNVTKVDRSPNMIRVHAAKPGVTSMVLVDEMRNMFTVEVFVIGDVRHLQAYLNRLFPHSSVSAVKIGDTVVLRGWVSQPEHITEMREIAEQFYAKVIDQMRVGGVQQVQLKVRVLEVQRNRIRKFGFNFLYANNDASLASTPGQLTPLIGFSPPGPGSLTNLSDPTLAFGIVNDSTVFQGFLEALKQESMLKILAEPELTTTNGRPAFMLAGGEFPLVVPQSLGTTTIQFKQFGVRLEAVPIILGNGRVRLELQPEVSEKDFTSAVTIGGTTVPGVTTRKVNTQVEMRFGETFMLAGLLSTRASATTSKLPLLGELPWIGAAFRRVRYEKGETELVIMVTPELVASSKGPQLPAGGIGLFTDEPTDRELYIDGRIEVPSYGDRCSGCGVDQIFSNGTHGAPGIKGVAPLTPAAQGGYHRVISSPVQTIKSPPAPSSNGPADDDRRTSMRSGIDRTSSRTSIGLDDGRYASTRGSAAGVDRTERLWDDSLRTGPRSPWSANPGYSAPGSRGNAVAGDSPFGSFDSARDTQSNRYYPR
jgi:pilus assembly protein CpaC